MKNPQKAIPIGIIISLLSCCAAYCSVSIIITLLVPYYDLDTSAPLPVAFQEVGYVVAKWVISIGTSALRSHSVLLLMAMSLVMELLLLL